MFLYRGLNFPVLADMIGYAMGCEYYLLSTKEWGDFIKTGELADSLPTEELLSLSVSMESEVAYQLESAIGL